MIFKRNEEIIIKLSTKDFAILSAVLFSSLMMAKDAEVRNDINDLLHAITSQMNE